MIRVHVATREDDPARGYLMIACDHSHDGYCRRSLWTRPAQHPMWSWNGNVERPTITPSIDCKLPGCGKHFTVTDGAVAP